MKMKKAAAWILLFALLLAGCGGHGPVPGEKGTFTQIGSADVSSGEDSRTLKEEPGGAEKQPANEVVSSGGTEGSVTLTIPEGWEYEITVKDDGTHDCLGYDGIRFWPEGKEGAVGLYYYADGFGVCGTGLEEHEITLPGGRTGQMGTYDQHEVWDYIVLLPFADEESGEKQSDGYTYVKPMMQVSGSYVALAEGIEDWWNEYEEAALEILGSAKFSEDRTKEATDFAVRLFQEVLAGQDSGENVLISPLSVLEALAMTANGARGETLKQMEETLGIPIESLNPYLDSYVSTLPQGENYRLHTANAIWMKECEDFTLNGEFAEKNKKYYGADIRRLPFDNAALEEINGWVGQQTDGMIPKILDVMQEDAFMYLVDAIAFEADWQDQYRDEDVRDDVFTLRDGTTQDVKLMYSTEHDYLQDENAQGFIKYYADGKYAFAALLPDEGISVEEYIASLDGGRLHEILENPVYGDVYAAIPEYEMEFGVNMEKVLAQMGMEDAFDPEKADLSGIGAFDPDSPSAQEGLYLDRVIHKTYISVDRKGTKAAAATAVEMRKLTAVMETNTYYVYLNRPFVYLLIDCEKNLPVFIGVQNSID